MVPLIIPGKQSSLVFSFLMIAKKAFLMQVSFFFWNLFSSISSTEDKSAIFGVNRYRSSTWVEYMTTLAESLWKRFLKLLTESFLFCAAVCLRAESHKKAIAKEQNMKAN